MSKAGIARLKANLSAYLRRVRRGETIVVMDRQTAVAKLVRIDEPVGAGLRVRNARRPLAELAEPERLLISGDIVDLLLDERGER